MEQEQTRQEIADTGRRLEAEGLLSATAGNISARVAPERIAITPTNIPYPEVRAADVVITDLAGRVVDGERRASSETPFHTAIYRARPDVGGVVHTHSPFATTLAVMRRPIPALHYVIASFGVAEIPVVDYETYGSDALARRLEEMAAERGQRRAAGQPRRGRVRHDARAGGDERVAARVPRRDVLPLPGRGRSGPAARGRDRPGGRALQDTRAATRVSLRDDLVLTVDGGGSSVKATVYSIGARAPVASASREVMADYPGDGLAEFDTRAWWAEIVAAIRGAVAGAGRRPGDYRGITCTGMRIPFVLVDGRGEPLAPCVLNLDRRGQAFLDDVRTALGPRELYRLTGHWANGKFGLPKLLWYRSERPEIWRRARRVLQFHDWLVHGLSGAVTSEPSSAGMSQMVDARRRCWATELLDALGIDRDLFPELHDGGERIGGLLPEVARATGLATGTPVHVGAGDTHLAVLGAGGTAPGTAAIVGGSTTPVMYASDQPLAASKAGGPLVSPHAVAGLWALETNAGATGNLYTWLRDLMGGVASDGYAKLDQLVEAAPLGARGLLVAAANPFWGEDAWERVPPTTFMGLTPAPPAGRPGPRRARIDRTSGAFEPRRARIGTPRAHRADRVHRRRQSQPGGLPVAGRCARPSHPRSHRARAGRRRRRRARRRRGCPRPARRRGLRARCRARPALHGASCALCRLLCPPPGELRRMTVAVVTADLTAWAERELAQTYGWSLRRLPRGGLAAPDANLVAAEVEVLVIEADPLDARQFDRFPTLSLVACLRGNPVNVDLDRATASGIPVVHTPGRNAEAVADLVLGLTLSCIRHIALTHHLIVSRALTEEREEQRDRKDVIWRPTDPGAPLPYVTYKGPELSRLTLGLLGFGAVARRVAAKATALDMRVLAHDPFVPDHRVSAAAVEPVPLPQLLRDADVLSLHAPSQTGAPLIGEHELRQMKPGSYLINTARASVLDYDALASALREGRLAGAGLDVFPDEPLSSSSPLLDLPNVTFTPHIGGASTHVLEHQSELLLDALRHLAAGRPEAAAIANPAALAGLPGGIPAALRSTAPTGSRSTERLRPT